MSGTSASRRSAWCALVAMALVLLPNALQAVVGDEPSSVRDAFKAIDRKLLQLTNYQADFSVTFDSLKGAVSITGTVVQQPSLALRRDLYLEEEGGAARKFERTICDGSNGWQIEYAPNGRVLNVSRWGEASMHELFYVLVQKSQLTLLSHDVTNTYTMLRRTVAFQRVIANGPSFELIGTDRTDTSSYKDLYQFAAAYGPQGISNYVTSRVVLRVDAHGLPLELTRENLLGRVIERARLYNIRVNAPLPADMFAYQPPPDTMVLDLDRAINTMPLHVAHPLLGKPAPAFSVSYLNGKELAVSPGSAPIVLTFFTSWSETSRRYLPTIEKLYRTYVNRGVRFVAVTDEKKLDTLRDYITSARLTMPVFRDEKGAVVKAYGMKFVPRTLLIGRNGLVVDVFEGAAPGVAAALDAGIRAALEQ
jgi:outer membrane lipoprotein-sorting protein/peroxiredoxin